MPFDDTDFDYGGHGMPEKLTLKGVYKYQAQGPAAYCAYGEVHGQEVELPERSLLFASAAAQGATQAVVAQLEKPGKEAKPVLLDVQDIARALEHIDQRAPDDRPDPLAAIA